MVLRFDFNEAVAVHDEFPADPVADAGADEIYMWINPLLGTEPDINTADAYLAFEGSRDTFGSFQFLDRYDLKFDRMRLKSRSDGSVYDEFRLGTTYTDVAPIAVTGQPGDFGGDLDVDGADFLIWQRDLGDTANLLDWEENFGTVPAVSAAIAVPEPSSLLLACTMAMATLAIGRCRRHSAKLLNFLASLE